MPLSDLGRDHLATWELPPSFTAWDWVSSPLGRASETARHLAGRTVATDDRLMEASWGEWEGCLLAELRRENGETMRANEARGLDFRPPGGESPRDVRERVRAFAADVLARGRSTIAVTHKGVQRAALSLGTGWTLEGKPPVAMARAALHVFEVADGGALTLRAANVALTTAPADEEGGAA